MIEIWKPVVGYECLYEVSSNGRVKALPKKRGCSLIKTPFILKQLTDISGYLIIGLHKENKQIIRKVHTIVAKAFIVNPENKPFVNHINGNKQNNSISNLEWVTTAENNKHAFTTGLIDNRGEKSALSKLNDNDVLEIYKSNDSLKILSNKYNVKSETIQAIRYGKTWNHITNAPIKRYKRYERT